MGCDGKVWLHDFKWSSGCSLLPQQPLVLKIRKGPRGKDEWKTSTCTGEFQNACYIWKVYRIFSLSFECSLGVHCRYCRFICEICRDSRVLADCCKYLWRVALLWPPRPNGRMLSAASKICRLRRSFIKEKKAPPTNTNRGTFHLWLNITLVVFLNQKHLL